MSEPDPKPDTKPDPQPQRAWQEGSNAPWSTTESLNRRLFESKLLADVTIVCADGKEIAAHSPLLLSSDFFVKAFKSNLKEAQTKRFVFERSTGDDPHLNLDHDVLNRMLEFMYCGTYAADADADEAVATTMSRHIDLCVLADYFAVEGLQAHATERACAVLEEWDAARPALAGIIAAAYHPGRPRHAVAGIRAGVVDVVAKQFGRELAPDRAFCRFLAGCGECCVDVMRRMCENRPPVTGYIVTQCYKCKKAFVVALRDDFTPAHCAHCGEKNHNSSLRYRGK
ncbi:hypothetical protein SLS58_003128 [Diplodia intermedia]|uniref:BTB domain-containing protein n=1 Tax=Diplodia intermedia TaxID=856260 RepID=A0ABR3TWX7_9PEZI